MFPMREVLWAVTPTEWAVEAFARLQKEWAAQADFESARKIPPSRKTLELQEFLMTAPDSVKRKVLRKRYDKR